MYREFLSKAYPVVSCTVFPVQLLLFYLIVRHTPKYLNKIKPILMCNCVAQTISLIICSLLQTRQVSHLNPMEVWCYGPLRHAPAHISYSLYFVAQTTVLVSTVMIFLTIYYKLDAVRNLTGDTYNTVMVTFLLLNFVVLTMVAEFSLVVSYSFPAEVQEIFRALNVDTSDHSIIGYITLNTPASWVVFVILSGTVFILPPIGLVIRSKILSTMNASIDRTSSNRRQHSRCFINGLTIQAILPFICYLPIFICLFYVIRTKTELLFEQYLIGVFTIIPALLDPFITLYSVRPYRRKILTCFGLWKIHARVVPSVQVINARV